MENSNDVCKVFVVETNERRCLIPKHDENYLDRILKHKRPSVIRKCLFGVADPEVTRRMLAEQYVFDQGRFMAKFGFDIESIEEMERTKDDLSENIENDRNGQNRGCGDVLTGRKIGKKILKARRKVTFNKPQTSQSQQYITGKLYEYYIV